MPDTSALLQRVRALEGEHNERLATIDWQFTNRRAGVKLKRLYPILNSRLDHVTGARSPC